MKPQTQTLQPSTIDNGANWIVALVLGRPELFNEGIYDLHLELKHLCPVKSAASRSGEMLHERR